MKTASISHRELLDNFEAATADADSFDITFKNASTGDFVRSEELINDLEGKVRTLAIVGTSASIEVDYLTTPETLIIEDSQLAIDVLSAFNVRILNSSLTYCPSPKPNHDMAVPEGCIDGYHTFEVRNSTFKGCRLGFRSLRISASTLVDTTVSHEDCGGDDASAVISESKVRTVDSDASTIEAVDLTFERTVFSGFSFITARSVAFVGSRFHLADDVDGAEVKAASITNKDSVLSGVSLV